MLSVSSAGKNLYSADKTNGLLRVDDFWVNTDLCWPTVGGERKVNLMFQKFVDNKNLSKEIFHFKKFWQRKQKKNCVGLTQGRR